MQIKVLSDSCVKVLIETEDINKYNVPFHALSQNDAHTLEFICELLFIILEQTGISFLEDDLTVRASSACGGNYYILISRSAGSDGMLIKKDEHYLDDAMYIYRFDDPRDLIGLRLCFARFEKFYPAQSTLYEYGGKYYLLLGFSVEQTRDAEFYALETMLCEFFTKCPHAFENEGVLCERGRLLCAAVLPLIIKRTGMESR